MKKLLATVAAVTLSVVPAVGASAATDIYGSDSQGYTSGYSSDSNSNNSTEAYSSTSVKYEALYYVNYEATTVDWLKQHSSTSTSENMQEDYFRNMQDRFHNSGYKQY